MLQCCTCRFGLSPRDATTSLSRRYGSQCVAGLTGCGEAHVLSTRLSDRARSLEGKDGITRKVLKMQRTMRRRYWAELVGALVSAALGVITVLSAEWIEVVFHVDPDGGDGTLEWLIVGIAATASLACGVLARVEWRRSAVLPAPGT